MQDCTSQSKRAPALPPAQRRTAIIKAVEPLLLAHGERVTSRQIAEAAGIAEGTIFRAFKDKDELICETLLAALDPTALEADLTNINHDLGLDEQLVEAVTLLQRRVAHVWALLSAVGPQTRQRVHKPKKSSVALQALTTRNEAHFAIQPERAGRLLHSLTISLTHPMMIEAPLTAPEIVELFLHGAVGSKVQDPTKKAKRQSSSVANSSLTNSSLTNSSLKNSSLKNSKGEQP